MQIKRAWMVVAGLLAAGCAVNPMTPVPTATKTPQPIVVVQVILPTETVTPPPTATWPTGTAVTMEPTNEKRIVAVEITVTPAPVVEQSVVVDPALQDDTGGGSGDSVEVDQPPAPTPIPPVWVAPPVSADVAAAEQYTIDLINAQRVAVGLAPYLRDEVVMGIARARVADMVARGYRGHYDPVTGISLARSMLLNAGYAWASENWYGHRNGPVAIADAAMAWFMTDPPHAAGILNTNYQFVGVGIAFNGTQWLLVQNFAGY